MKLSRQHLTATSAASKDDTRAVLNSLYVYQENGQTVAVATDSYRLHEVREPIQEGESGNESVLMPLDDAKFAEQMIKPHKSLYHLDVEAEKISVNGTLHDYKQTGGKYPDYKQIIAGAEQKEPMVVRLNPKFVADAMKFFKDEPGVTIEVRGELDPVIFRSEGITTKTAVVMPLRR